MKTEEILLKHLAAHFGKGDEDFPRVGIDAAELYLNDRPGLAIALDAAMKETGTEFGRWIEREYTVIFLYSTASIFDMFNNEFNKPY